MNRPRAAARMTRMLSLGGTSRPEVVAVAIAAACASCVAAWLARHQVAWGDLSLSPHAVVSGAAWRLVPWMLVERSPLVLALDLALLVRFGSDVAKALTRASFLFSYFALGLCVALGVVAIGFLDNEVRSMRYAGLSAMVQAVVVAWGLVEPERRLRLLGMGLTGRRVAVLAVLASLAWAAYYGVRHELPALVAVSTTLASLRAVHPTSRRPRRREIERKNAPNVSVVRRGDRWIVEVEDERAPP